MKWFFLFFFFCINLYSYPEDFFDKGLPYKGPVKNAKKFSIKQDSSKKIIKELLNEERYDKKGNITNNLIYSYSQLSKKIIYHYKKNFTEIEIQEYSENSKTPEKTILINKNINQKIITECIKKKSCTKTILTFNQQNKITDMKSFIKDQNKEKLDFYYTTRWDKNNNLLEEIQSYHSSKLIFKKSFIYDEFQNIIEEISQNDSTITLKKNKYNEKNQLIFQEIIEDDEPVAGIVFVYNSSGKTIEKITNSQRKYQNKIERFLYNPENQLLKHDIIEEINYNNKTSFTYQYNKNGEILIESQYDDKDNLLNKRVYEYDPYGNIIKFNLLNSDGNLLEGFLLELEFWKD